MEQNNSSSQSIYIQYNTSYPHYFHNSLLGQNGISNCYFHHRKFHFQWQIGYCYHNLLHKNLFTIKASSKGIETIKNHFSFEKCLAVFESQSARLIFYNSLKHNLIPLTWQIKCWCTSSMTNAFYTMICIGAFSTAISPIKIAFSIVCFIIANTICNQSSIYAVFRDKKRNLSIWWTNNHIDLCGEKLCHDSCFSLCLNILVCN